MFNPGTLLHEQFPRLLPIRLGQAVKKSVFPLQRADHWRAKVVSQATEERVGEAHYIGLGLRAQPSKEPVDFAGFTSQHFHGSNAEVFGTSQSGQAGGLTEERRRTQRAIEPARHRKSAP